MVTSCALQEPTHAYILTSQLLPIYVSLSTTTHPKKKQLFGFLLALALLFPTFISLCGLTHTLSVIEMLIPESFALQKAMDVVMLCCAAVSIVTAVVGYKIFPTVLEIVRKFELNSEGNLESAQAYLLEIVDMIKESMMEISDDGRVLRCNEASKFLFGQDIVGSKVVTHLHPDDVQLFNDAILRVLSSYNRTPCTVEYRVRCNEDTFEREPDLPVCPMPKSATNTNRWNALGTPKVHCDIESGSVFSSHSGEQTMEDFKHQILTMAINNIAQEEASNAQQTLSAATYIWVESTMCKGVKLDDSEQFEYDIKLATRNINDRKKLQDL